MQILSVKKICLCYGLLLNDWNYFWNKYYNLPFLAICHSLLTLLIFLASSWYQKAKIGLRVSLRNKKMITILKDFIKQSVIKQSPTFLSFSFLIDCNISFLFSFPYQSVCKFWKIDKISLANFHCIQKWRKSENADRNI